MSKIREVILWFMLLVMMIIGHENIFIDLVAVTILCISGLLILYEGKK